MKTLHDELKLFAEAAAEVFHTHFAIRPTVAPEPAGGNLLPLPSYTAIAGFRGTRSGVVALQSIGNAAAQLNAWHRGFEGDLPEIAAASTLAEMAELIARGTARRMKIKETAAVWPAAILHGDGHQFHPPAGACTEWYRIECEFGAFRLVAALA